MSVNTGAYHQLINELAESKTTLVAVSKIKPAKDILELYHLNQRDFGENYVQELVEKEAQLPKDIRWHFIGHLQRNKVKYIAPFVHLIHGVDSLSLLKEINKQGAKNNRKIHCLLQVHIAQESTKFGLDEDEVKSIIQDLNAVPNVVVQGLMGMATFTEDENQIRAELKGLKKIFNEVKPLVSENFSVLSMGMSADYKIAIEEGSNMVRIGSLIFGAR